MTHLKYLNLARQVDETLRGTVGRMEVEFFQNLERHASAQYREEPVHTHDALLQLIHNEVAQHGPSAKATTLLDQLNTAITSHFNGLDLLCGEPFEFEGHERHIIHPDLLRGEHINAAKAILEAARQEEALQDPTPAAPTSPARIWRPIAAAAAITTLATGGYLLNRTPAPKEKESDMAPPIVKLEPIAPPPTPEAAAASIAKPALASDHPIQPIP